MLRLKLFRKLHHCKKNTHRKQLKHKAAEAEFNYYVSDYIFNMSIKNLPLRHKLHKTYKIKFIDRMNINNPNYHKILKIFYVLFATFYTIWIFGKTQNYYPGGFIEIPLILKLINPDLFLNDFFTNSVIHSPKIVYAYFVAMWTYFGWTIDQILHFCMLARTFFVSPLIFLVICKIYDSWFPKKNLLILIFIYTIILLLLYTKIIPWGQFGKPAGWNAMGARGGSFYPATLSYALGILYVYICFYRKPIRYFAPIFLLLATLIHPSISVFSFIFLCIFYLPILHDKKSLQFLAIDFFIGIILPILVYFIIFPSANMSGVEFIEHYIELRHPHHYLISRIVSSSTIKWLILFTAPLIPVIFFKNSKIIIMCFLCILSYAGSIFLQYAGTEIFHIKFIAQLGSNRFTIYREVIWMTQIVLICGFFFNTLFKQNKENVYLNTSFMEAIYYRFYILIYIITVLFFALVISKNTFKPFKPEKQAKIISWIKNKTSKNDVFFIDEWVKKKNSPRVTFGLKRPLPHEYIRTHAHRAIFSDMSFPFNEKYIREFTKRRDIQQKIHFVRSPMAYYCLSKYYRVDYIITNRRSTKTFAAHKPIFDDGNYIVYKISDFKNKNLNCNLFFTSDGQPLTHQSP